MNSQTDKADQIPCWIYRSSRKEDMYLYLSKKDDLEEVPDDLQKSLGELVFVMQLELSEQRKLARANVSEVMKSLNSEGYYLQLPPKLIPDLHFGD
ncbi:MAG: YcgL domain-containing protein [Gammaproteobacteria bacterium]